ncbi:MAG: glycoside hydrolase family 3 C-terminal domain-containing protein [Pseudomonas sp.]|nr:glycoside hydrolase family 3 C-terminal domain-containing protein [Pseudomonas sp.]
MADESQVRPVANEARVNALLQKMTADEKFNVIRGLTEDDRTNQGQAGYLPGVPRLGVAALRLADGPPGILTRKASIIPTSTMGLAATFSKQDAYDNGVLIGTEAKRLGIDIALEPFINMFRDSGFRRGWNTFGEDPLLTGAMGAGIIKGIQAQGVMAQAKHFVGYDMTGFDVTIPEQALHEVYLAPFQDAIDAGVASIMCAYNKVNGEFGCGNAQLLEHVLRGQMGFKGFVTSDWGGVHSAQYIKRGMDMEMPGRIDEHHPFWDIMRSYYDNTAQQQPALHTSMGSMKKVFARPMPEEWTVGKRPVVLLGQFPNDEKPSNMFEALRDHTVAQKDIDTAAGRILGQMERFGYLDHPGHQPQATPVTPAMMEIARRTSEHSAVLLKNDDHVLPLTKKDLGALAMIGPGAVQPVALGISAEHAIGIPALQVGPAKALGTLEPDAVITVAVANDMTGVAIAADKVSFQGQPGWVRSEAGQTVRDRQLAFADSTGNALKPGALPVWQTHLNIDQAGDYDLNLQMLGAGAVLKVDGVVVGESSSLKNALHGDVVHPGQDALMPTTDGLNNVRRRVTLSQGEHLLEVSTYSDTSQAPVQVRLNWVTPAMRADTRAKAIAAAKGANKVVVFAWSRSDPQFGLPGDQDALIEEIAAINPNTIVVLNTSTPVAMPWLGKVKGLVQMWWTGDEGGQATANLLAGKANPGGRLPFTWGKTLQDYPATDPRFPERGQQLDGVVHYTEGLNIGYRWFEAQHKAPLFAFGYGLSYTQFGYGDLKTRHLANGDLQVDFQLTNHGKVAGDDVPQLYLGPPQRLIDGAEFAPKTLVGFDRVTLGAGQTRHVSIQVPLRKLQYWSVKDQAWRLAAGTRDLMLSTSADQAAVTQAVQF